MINTYFRILVSEYTLTITHIVASSSPLFDSKLVEGEILDKLGLNIIPDIYTEWNGVLQSSDYVKGSSLLKSFEEAVPSLEKKPVLKEEFLDTIEIVLMEKNIEPRYIKNRNKVMELSTENIQNEEVRKIVEEDIENFKITSQKLVRNPNVM